MHLPPPPDPQAPAPSAEAKRHRAAPKASPCPLLTTSPCTVTTHTRHRCPARQNYLLLSLLRPPAVPPPPPPCPSHALSLPPSLHLHLHLHLSPRPQFSGFAYTTIFACNTLFFTHPGLADSDLSIMSELPPPRQEALLASPTHTQPGLGSCRSPFPCVQPICCILHG